MSSDLPGINQSNRIAEQSGSRTKPLAVARGPALRMVVVCFAATASSCSSGARPGGAPAPQPDDCAAEIPTPTHVDTEESFWPEPVERTRVRLYALQQLVLGFEARTGRLPDSLSDFLPPAGGPIGFAHDAWSHPFTYVRTGSDFVLRAPGADGIAGSTNDLVMSRDAVRPVVDHREQTTRVHLCFLRERLLAERARAGEFPASLADLLPPGVEEPRFTRDRWNEAIRYIRRRSGFELRSAGADRRMYTDDDLVVTEEEISSTGQPPA